MIFGQSKKEKYLRVSQWNKKKTAKKKKIGKGFFKALRDDELPMDTKGFLGLSLICGVIVFLIYTLLIKEFLISIPCGIISISIPYLLFKTNWMMNRTVERAMGYKDFVGALQSALRSTNSTAEAIKMAASENGLNKELREIMDTAVSNISLGDSIENVLEKAINSTDQTYFKMALTIVKINHSIGASTSMDALDNIQDSMNHIIDNVQLLKDKISTIILDKSIFLGITLAAPIAHCVTAADIVGSFYATPKYQLLFLAVVAFCFAGQFFMDWKAGRTMEGI